MFDTYKQRNELLKALGFKSYKAYLGSSLWKVIRSRVLKLAKGQCEVCRSATATQVHHKKYDEATLKGESTRYLVAICDECHALGEFDFARKKTDLPECNQRHSALRSKSHERHIASRNICFVCRVNAVSRINGKCKQCLRKTKPVAKD